MSLTETEICASVLRRLAMGETPSHLMPSPGDLLNQTDLDSLNQTSWIDANLYGKETYEQHQHSITVALSILSDSTSPGPDPLALKALGWAYGMGGGGGMGDWDGCHYVPGDIGATLRVLQDQVAFQLLDKIYNPDGDASPSEMTNATKSLKEAWWLQKQKLEYGQGYNRAATRFCTVGSLPAYTKPYVTGGVLWAPPVAGVCVPSTCTAKGLYELFDEEGIFANELLALAERDGFIGNRTSGQVIPTMSRRFRYMLSLSQSMSAGKTFKMGIDCEGESGLRELDEEGYRGYGYYATVALIFLLLLCCVFGTTSARVFPKKKILCDDQDDSKKKKEDFAAPTNKELDSFSRQHPTSPTTLFEYGARNETDIENERINPYMNGDIAAQEERESVEGNESHHSEASKELDSSFRPLLSTSNSRLEYGSRNETDIESESSNYAYTNGDGGTHERGSVANESDRSQENVEENLSLLPNCDIDAQTGSDCSSWDSPTKRDGDVTHYSWMRMEDFLSKFAHFDLAQSFNEITSTKRDSSIPNIGHGRNVVSVSSSKCLDGMRSLSMLWIIVGHTFAVSSSIGYQNPAAFLPPTGMMTSFLGITIISARYAVDTFFFISGHLVMSGLLKRMDPNLTKEKIEEEAVEVKVWKRRLIQWGFVNPKHSVVGDYVTRITSIIENPSAASEDPFHNFKGIRWVVPFLIHRILRILPTYAFVLLLWWKIAVTLGEGPFWQRWATFVAQCDAHAWTNMFFVNNVVPWYQPFGETSECMYHTWYLAVDFQLCAILTPICFCLYVRPGMRKRTILLEILFVCSIIGTSIYFTYRYGWSDLLGDGANTVAFDRGFYTNSFFRSSPYIIGFITAQLWHEKCRLWPNMGLNKRVAFVLSFFSITLMMFLSVCGVSAASRRPCLIWESPRTTACGSGWSTIRLAIYNSFFRPTWGFGISIMSLLSFNGQLNSLGASTVLNWSGWGPMAKLSFTMYLLHPLIINLWVFGSDSKSRYSLINSAYAFSGTVSITLLMSLVVAILVEWPISKVTRDLEKKFLLPSKVKE